MNDIHCSAAAELYSALLIHTARDAIEILPGALITQEFSYFSE